MWKMRRLRSALLLQLLLLVVVSGENFSKIPTSTSGGHVGCFYHYGIRAQTNSSSKVCPVTNLEPTVLQPSTNSKINGSFFVDWQQSSGQQLFGLQYVEEHCCPDPMVSIVAGSSDNRCDKLYIVRRGIIDRRESFLIKYISSEGEVAVTEILYGRDGVSLIQPLPENGMPLPVNDRTILQYELRIPTVDGQSLPSPILCERTPSGTYKHTEAFHVQPNSPTPGCLSSNQRNGYSTPYITEVTPDNLSSLFSDPTAIYLTYSGTCNSSDTSLSSVISNITAMVTDYTTHHMVTSAATATQYNDTSETTPTDSTSPPTDSASSPTTANSTDSNSLSYGPITAGDDSTTDVNGAEVATTVVNAVVESTEVTQVTGHPGSTHTATAVNSNPLHFAGTLITIVLVSSVVLVVLGAVVVFFVCKSLTKHKGKLDVEHPDDKIPDDPPAKLTCATIDVDTDSGVVEGSGGGTPLSDHAFTLNDQGCTTPTQKRESGLTVSSESRSSAVIKEINDLNKKVAKSHQTLEDIRDFMYGEKLQVTQSDINEEEAG